MGQTQRHSNTPQFTIHDRLRKAREVADLEQAELAARIEVDRGTISNYETGKVTRLKAPVLKRWALACEVDVDWLIDGIEDGPDGGGQRDPGTPAVNGESSSACTRYPLRLVA